MKNPVAPLRLSCLSLLAAAAWFAAQAEAMVVVERDFHDLAQRAEQIVAGTVTEIRTGTVAGAPITFVTVTDLTVMKGAAGDSITLEMYGGNDGEYAVKVPDMPSFSVGEEVVLFIAGNGRNVSPFVGVWQGVFRVRFDEARGERVVTANGGTPVTGIVGGKVQLAAPEQGGGATAGSAMTLEQLREAIADELANPSGAAR
jgi:hypothetical protein